MDEDDPDSKVIRLFPAKGDDARPPHPRTDGEPRARGLDPMILDQIESVLDQIGLDDPPPAKPADGPPPGYTNAERADHRRRRRLLIWRCCILVGWLVAGICFYLANFGYRGMLPNVRDGLYGASIVLAGFNLLVSMFLFQDDESR